MFPSDWPRPIRGTGGAAVDEAMWPDKPNPWLIVHNRIAMAVRSGVWNEATEREWYRTDFLPLIPRSCCVDNWRPIEKTLDWSSAKAAFESWWAAHNLVSEKHSGRPTISFAECCALYGVEI